MKLKAMSDPVEREIDDGRGVERENLAQNQTADDCDSQGTAKLGAHATAERQWQAAEQRGHGGHHDGPEAQKTCFIDGVERRLPFLALGFQREVDHHDGVLFHDADQRDDAEFGTAQQQGQDGAYTRGGQRGQNRDRMNVTFVENAEHDVHRYERSQNQNRLVGERAQESRGRALEGGLNAWRHANFIFDFVNGVDRFTESGIGSKIERQGHYRELPLVIDGQSRTARFKTGERAERNLRRRARGGRRGGRGDRSAGSRRRRLAGRRMYINVFQIFRVLLELRVYFQDDVVLIQLREDSGDQALAECVVERVVYVGGKNPEARCRIAIDGEHREQALVLLIAGDITQLRQLLELFHEARDPIDQLLGVHVLQAVLKLRAADAIFHGEVLHRLHEQRYTVHLGERGLQAPDYVGRGNLALTEGLEVDLDTPAVESCIDPINADERRQALDGRVLQNHVGQGALPAHHGREGNVLRTF